MAYFLVSICRDSCSNDNTLAFSNDENFAKDNFTIILWITLYLHIQTVYIYTAIVFIMENKNYYCKQY